MTIHLRPTSAAAGVALREPETDELVTPLSGMRVEHLHSLSDLRAALPEWQAFYALTGVYNPFIDPLWLVPWAEHYAGTRDLDVLFIREDGHLVGVAPFAQSSFRRLGVLGPVRLQLLGSDGKDNLTELTEPLLSPERRRAILRKIVTEVTARARWDWMELPLSPEQGWIETQWWPMRGRHPDYVAIHKGTVASVILDLGPGGAVHLKRNIRRIIRHRRNQLIRQHAVVEIQRLDCPEQMGAGLRTLRRLHSARSAMTGVPKHPDMLATERSRAFLADAVPGMASAGHAAIYVLLIDQQPAAVQLVLIANGCYYLTLSGIDPASWHSSPLTLLTSAIIDDAAARGGKRVNLSTGPNTAKLAWSELIEFHQQFLIVRRSIFSSLQFTAYWQARSFDRFWREHRHQRRQGG
jgi:CelD/BcsL family acetyltransferase involved in cellulose biosynthesis